MENFVYPFEKLRAYQEARIMVASIYKLIRTYPDEEKYALCAQMRRSAVSVTSNIAEGTTRSTLKDKIHFIEIAYGSLMELFSQLQVSLDLGYISEADYNEARKTIISVAQPLSGLRSSFIKSLSDKR